MSGLSILRPRPVYFVFRTILFLSDRGIKLCTSGDNNWKNIKQTLKVNETSAKHINSIMTSTDSAASRIDEKSHKTM